MDLVIVGANARLSQLILSDETFVNGFRTISLVTKTPYAGTNISNANHLQLRSVANAPHQIAELSRSLDDHVIIYAGSFNRRGVRPCGLEELDPDLSVFIQNMVLETSSVRRLLLLGSTQAITFLPGRDRYIQNKITEYKYFLKLLKTDTSGKITYIALPPLDQSDHLVGRFFVRSRSYCASIVRQAVFSRDRFFVPSGLFLLVAFFTSRGIKIQRF